MFSGFRAFILIFSLFFLGSVHASDGPSCIPTIEAFGPDPDVLKLFEGQNISELQARLSEVSRSLRKDSQIETVRAIQPLSSAELQLIASRLIQKQQKLLMSAILEAKTLSRDHNIKKRGDGIDRDHNIKSPGDFVEPDTEDEDSPDKIDRDHNIKIPGNVAEPDTETEGLPDGINRDHNISAFRELPIRELPIREFPEAVQEYLYGRLSHSDYFKIKQKTFESVAELNEAIIGLSSLQLDSQPHLIERVNEAMQILELLAAWDRFRKGFTPHDDFVSLVSHFDVLSTQSHEALSEARVKIQTRQLIREEITFWMSQIAWWESRL